MNYEERVKLGRQVFSQAEELYRQFIEEAEDNPALQHLVIEALDGVSFEKMNDKEKLAVAEMFKTTWLIGVTWLILKSVKPKKN